MTGANPIQASERQAEMPADPLTVFIADDSDAVAEMLTELIRDPGRIEVVGVGATEEAAIASIRAIRPDVVVLDLQLKTGSGTNVIRAVRASEDLAHVRVVVTSNHTSPQLRTGCLELGADDYFDKVKELPRLTARLARFAEEKHG
jgi:DNA-binding NarL/FixJ family response regulator